MKKLRLVIWHRWPMLAVESTHFFYKGAADAHIGERNSCTFMSLRTLIKLFIKWNPLSTLKLDAFLPFTDLQ